MWDVPEFHHGPYTPHRSVQVSALTFFAALPRCVASYPLPVRQASALPRASFRFAVTRDTLASG